MSDTNLNVLQEVQLESCCRNQKIPTPQQLSKELLYLNMESEVISSAFVWIWMTWKALIFIEHSPTTRKGRERAAEQVLLYSESQVSLST